MNTFPGLKNPTKLADQQGNLLGLMFVPDRVTEGIATHGDVQIALHPYQSVQAFSGYGFLPPPVVQVTYAIFVQSHSIRDAIVLIDMEPHEMNREPGFYFLPLRK